MAVKIDVKTEKANERKGRPEEREDLFKAWTEGYAAASRVWEESYLKLYKPWLESAGKMFERSSKIFKDATPVEYREFFDEWTKTYQKTFGGLNNAPTPETTRDALSKFLTGAEKSSKVFKSWNDELEKNARKTAEIMEGPPDPAKYKEGYDMWVKSYDRMMDEMLTLPAMESMSSAYEQYTGLPDIYSRTFVQVIKLWRDTYTKMYAPLVEAMGNLESKAVDISRGGGSPEAYKDFYTLWENTSQDLYRQYFQSVRPPKDAFESFAKASDLYLSTYKSWIETLEKMTEKTKELTKQSGDPAAQREFYDVWLKMYDKAFNNFFENMPVMGPMKEMMEPVKIVARMYSDTLDNMSKTWSSWTKV
jgi:hypothetical protein